MALEFSIEYFRGTFSQVTKEAQHLLDQGWRIPTKEDIKEIYRIERNEVYAKVPTQDRSSWWWTSTIGFNNCHPERLSPAKTNRELLKKKPEYWIANLYDPIYEGHWGRPEEDMRNLRLVRDI